MARKFLTAIDLAKNELQNAAVQSLGSAPSSPVKFQLYGNTGDNTLYWWDGSSWVPAKATGGAFPGYGSVPAETTYNIAKADGAATTVARSDHTHGTPNYPTPNQLLAPTAHWNFGTVYTITGVAAPLLANDVATKTYVDNLVAGLSWKDPVRIASTAQRGLTGLAAIDGVTPVANDRVLLKDQTSAIENGLWVAQSGAWSRAADGDVAGELEGAAVWVQEGTANGDKAFVCTTNGVIWPGSDANNWVQFGAGTSYVAGAGLALSGSTFNVGAANGSVTVGTDDIQVAYAGSGTTFGTAVTAARSDHNHAGTYTGKYTLATVGGATSQVITHNLNTQAVVVNVYRTLTPWDTVECDVERTTVNTVTLRFATAPATNEYSVVVIG